MINNEFVYLNVLMDDDKTPFQLITTLKRLFGNIPIKLWAFEGSQERIYDVNEIKKHRTTYTQYLMYVSKVHSLRFYTKDYKLSSIELYLHGDVKMEFEFYADRVKYGK